MHRPNKADWQAGSEHERVGVDCSADGLGDAHQQCRALRRERTRRWQTDNQSDGNLLYNSQMVTGRSIGKPRRKTWRVCNKAFERASSFRTPIKTPRFRETAP